MTFSWCQEGRFDVVIIVQLGPNAGLTGCQTESICLPPQMAALTRQTSHPATCWGDTKTTLTSLNDCELGISQLFTPQRLMLDRHCCKGRELEEHREILREIWALRQWLCLSFTSLLDTPHGKFKEVVNF